MRLRTNVPYFSCCVEGGKIEPYKFECSIHTNPSDNCPTRQVKLRLTPLYCIVLSDNCPTRRWIIFAWVGVNATSEADDTT